MMKQIWLVLAFCTVCAVMLVPQAQSQESVRLEYKYTPGELLRYKMQFDATLNVQGAEGGQSLEMPMRMAGVMRQKTNRVLPSGDAEIVISFESMRMQMENQIHEMPVKQLPAMTFVVTKSGQVRSASIPGTNFSAPFSSEMFTPGGFGNYVFLPTTELRVGDTWTQDISNIPGFGTIRSTGKLISTNTNIGKYRVAAFRQSVSGSLAMGMPMALSTQEGTGGLPGVDAKGAFLGDGTVYFSVEQGRLIRTTGTIDMQLNVSVPKTSQSPSGANAAVTMAITYDMFLLPPVKTK